MLCLCLVVLVLRALSRRPDGNRSQRECAGCAVSVSGRSGAQSSVASTRR